MVAVLVAAVPLSHVVLLCCGDLVTRQWVVMEAVRVTREAIRQMLTWSGLADASLFR